MSNNNDELTEEKFWAILAAVPEPRTPIFRLYYDDQGQVLFYSMEDLPGNYIEITQHQYMNSDTSVRVRDGKLIKVNWITTQCLEPGDTGTPCHPTNVAIVVDPSQEHECWSKRTYEQS